MSASQYPPIQIVNDNDEPVGSVNMFEAYEKGLIHRIVFIIVEDTDGKILLQKRSANVATSRNKWDISAAGHVDAGESYLSAATRELEEEVGIAAFPLREVAKYRADPTIDGIKLSRFVTVFKVTVPPGTPTNPNLDEVSEVSWFAPEALKQMTVERPEEFAHGFSECAERHFL